MSFDLFSQEVDNRIASLRPVMEPEPGAFHNFLPGTAKVTMQTFAKAGSAVDLIGSVGPIAQDKFFSKPGTTEAQDKYFKEHEDVFGKAVDYWTPKPNEVGTAGQVVGQLLGTLPMVVASPALAVGATQVSTAEDLVKKGVDPTKAQQVGAVQAAGLGLGIWVPILGKTLAQRVLLGGAGFNAFQGIATRGASGEILEGTPAAQDFKAFDPTGLTLDLLLGAAFGGLAHVVPSMRAEGDIWHAKMAEWGAKLKPSEVDALVTLRQAQHINADSMPGKPADMASTDAHVQRIRQAIDDLANDRPVNVEQMPAPKFEPDPERQAETAATVKALQDDAATTAEAEKINIDRSPAADPWNEPQPPRTLEQRIADQTIRAELSVMKGETGWAETGGKLLRDAGDEGNVIGRTHWVPNAEWWPGRPKGLKETEVRKAVDKALAGETLTTKERKMVEYMADVAEQRVKLAAFKLFAEDLAQHDLSSHNELNVAMTARAAELNPDAVEALAIRFESDDAGFMRGIKELLDEHDRTNTGRSEAGTGTQAADASPAAARPADTQTAGLDPLAAEAQRFAADNPDLKIAIGKNADGSDITTTPREWLDQAEADLAGAHEDARLFQIAAECLLGAA